MKKPIKYILFTAITLYIISRLFPQVHFASIQVILTASIIIALLEWIVRPILKILLLPVNLITFGLFSWVMNIIVMYTAVLLVPGFTIGKIIIPQLQLGVFVFPAYTLSKFWSLFFVSFLISFGNSMLAWIL